MGKFVDAITLIREIIADDKKMTKFREIVMDVKELLSDLKDVSLMFRK